MGAACDLLYSVGLYEHSEHVLLMCPLSYEWWEWCPEVSERSYTGLGDSYGNAVVMLWECCCTSVGIAPLTACQTCIQACIEAPCHPHGGI